MLAKDAIYRLVEVVKPTADEGEAATLAHRIVCRLLLAVNESRGLGSARWSAIVEEVHEIAADDGGPPPHVVEAVCALVRYMAAGFVLLLALSTAAAAAAEHAATMDIPPEYRAWFRNPDGSCVQCSIGMVGMWNNLPAWTYVLWDTEYGPAQRGGSWPGRVAKYARERGMKMYNVTGTSFEDTRPWMIWAAQTGRFAAIGAGRAHFQTLYGYVPTDAKPWKVCNNNSTWRIDEYTEEEFRRLHMASGPWVVIPDEPPGPPPPKIVAWWQ
mgnify:CR=1 FL=1